MPLLRRPRGGMPSTSQGVIPAPVRGLNAREGLPSMDAQDAVILDNIYPETSWCSIRRGFADWTTGITGNVESLLEWNGPASSKLKAAIGTSIYDVTSSGALGAAELTSLTNARWQHVNFSTSGGNYLVIVNGAASMRAYDGSSWSTPSVTVATSSTFIQVTSHQNRLWFVQKDTLDAWYLPVESIAGAAAKFPLGPVFQRGGKLKLIGTLTRDAGDGMDDYLVFVSSNGEVAVYSGTDPTQAATWGLVGVYRTGAPIGDRALLRVGGDLALITNAGVVSISAVMAQDRSAADKAAITDRIVDAFSEAALDFGSNYGWQAILYPKNHAAYFNVPISSTQAIQYVMNLQTGAWCRFTNHNAFCWAVFGESLYFGGVNGIWKADTGHDDDGANIPWAMLTAFSYLGGQGKKRITAVQPLVKANALPELAFRVNVDFKTDPPVPADTFELDPSTIDGMIWDTSVWDAAMWAGDDEYYDHTYSADGVGRAIAVYVKGATQGVRMDFTAFTVLYERQRAMAL